jgi:hypothetical protein
MIAKTMNEYPSIEESQRKICEYEEEIENFELMKESEEINLKHKQVHFITSYLQDLEKSN